MKDKADTSEVVELLKSFAVYQQQFFAKKYAKTFYDPYDKFQGLDNGECEKKLDFIKSLVVGLAPSRFATLLNLHYINELPLDVCAECMLMSRSSVYRLLDRAHIAVNNRYQRMKMEE